MKKKMLQMSRYGVCCFFMLTCMGCGRLSHQLGAQAKEHTEATAAKSKEEEKNGKAQKKANSQANRGTKVAAIPMLPSLILMIFLSQMSPGNGSNTFCSQFEDWGRNYSKLYNNNTMRNLKNVMESLCFEELGNSGKNRKNCTEYDNCINFYRSYNSSGIKQEQCEKLEEVERNIISLKNVQEHKLISDDDLDKLRSDRALLQNNYFARPFPSCSEGFYFAPCMNSSGLFFRDHLACIKAVCNNNKCSRDYNGASHRVARATIDSQKAEGKAKQKREGLKHKRSPNSNNPFRKN